MKTLVIDAGHGGHDSGAVGPTGLKEKTIALNVAQAVARNLKPFIDSGKLDVRMTRNSDVFVTLSGRAQMANDLGADAFISIHCNAAGGHGHEVFTSPGQTLGDKLATKCFSRYSEAFPDLPKRTDFGDGDPDKEARFTVLTKTRAPSCLYELEFIDTIKGENFLNSPVNQEKAAEALARGCREFLGLSVQPTPQLPNAAYDVLALKELEDQLDTLNEELKGSIEALQHVLATAKRVLEDAGS